MTVVYGFLGGILGGGAVVIGFVYAIKRQLARLPLLAKPVKRDPLSREHVAGQGLPGR